MKLTFEISELALKDLYNIWEYTAEQQSDEQTNKYYNEKFSAIGKICENPDIGKPINDVKKEHRRTNVKSYMFIYKVKETTAYTDKNIA